MGQKMKGRRLGSTEVTLKELKIITDMTQKDCNRSDIAKKLGRCNDTIYRYQKKLDLI